MMTVGDFIDKCSGSMWVTIAIYGKILACFDSAYQSGISSDILAMEVADYAFDEVYMHKTHVVVNVTAEDVTVETIGMLQAALNDDFVKVIVLNADIGIDFVGGFTLSSGEKALNLNGHNITGMKASDGVGTANAIQIQNGATLIINGEGTIDGGYGCTNNVALCVEGEGSKAIVNDGTFDVGLDARGAENYTVLATDDGEIEINGGFFKNTGADGKGTTAEKGCVLGVTKDGTISCYGGKFKNQNPEEGGFVPIGFGVEETAEGDDTIYSITATD